MGIEGEAFEARKRPRAFLRLERTRTMRVLGREGVFWASMRAWRFVPAWRIVWVICMFCEIGLIAYLHLR